MPKISKVNHMAVIFITWLIRSQGYLRCGKVLQLQNKDKVALQIYDKGLKTVKIGADKDRLVSG